MQDFGCELYYWDPITGFLSSRLLWPYALLGSGASWFKKTQDIYSKWCPSAIKTLAVVGLGLISPVGQPLDEIAPHSRIKLCQIITSNLRPLLMMLSHVCKPHPYSLFKIVCTALACELQTFSFSFP